MAASDITVSGLNKVGAEDAAYLVSKIRTIPGFPKEGILFRDFMPVLADARAFGILMGALEAALPVDVDDFDMVAGLDGLEGDAFDRAFLEMMIPHHQGAIDMAELVLQNAKHDELKEMARAIITAQQAEIDQMNRWMSDWGYSQ